MGQPKPPRDWTEEHVLWCFYRRSSVFATGLFEPAMAAAPDHGTDQRGPLLTKHLVEGRSCGPCVGCCSIYQIPALQKPKYTLCKHCTGTSCAIYDDRPDDCRKFFCLWRRIAAMHEE